MKKFVLIIASLLVIALILILGVLRINAYDHNKDKSEVWVASFQIAWNELTEKLGTTIQFDGKNKLVDELNQQTFKKEMLNPDSYYVKTGYINTKLRDELNYELNQLKNFESKILERTNWEKSSPGYLIYALLNKNFTFETPFTKMDGTFQGFEDKIQYFGLDSKTNPKAFNQVSLLFYNSDNDFAVKIVTKEQEELILYRTDNFESFDNNYNEIIKKSNNLTEKKNLISGEDELRIPFMNINQEVNYNELCNKKIKNTDGIYISQAIQNIEFNLDNYGGNITSEAAIYTLASLNEKEPNKYYFNDKFLLYIKEKDKEKPYFAVKCWDLEFLNKVK